MKSVLGSSGIRKIHCDQGGFRQEKTRFLTVQFSSLKRVKQTGRTESWFKQLSKEAGTFKFKIDDTCDLFLKENQFLSKFSQYPKMENLARAPSCEMTSLVLMRTINELPSCTDDKIQKYRVDI